MEPAAIPRAKRDPELDEVPGDPTPRKQTRSALQERTPVWRKDGQAAKRAAWIIGSPTTGSVTRPDQPVRSGGRVSASCQQLPSKRGESSPIAETRSCRKAA
jgi:hypothetical protein